MWRFRFCQVLTNPFQLFLVVVVYGQGMLPWKFAAFLNFLLRANWRPDIFPCFKNLFIVVLLLH